MKKKVCDFIHSKNSCEAYKQGLNDGTKATLKEVLDVMDKVIVEHGWIITFASFEGFKKKLEAKIGELGK